MADLVLQSQNIISADVPQLSFDESIANRLDNEAAAQAKIAENFQQKADNIFANKFELQTRQNVNAIYNESPNDPDLVKKKIDQYADGVFKDIPFERRSDFRKLYNSISTPLVTKAFENKNKILTNELIVSNSQNRDQILIDIQMGAENLLIDDPTLSPEENYVRKTQALNALETNFQSLNDNLSTVGPDGQPLYSPKEQLKVISNAKEVMLSEASKKWLDQQPNKIQALKAWSSGGLIYPLHDGEKIINVPVKAAFNPAIVGKVEKELIARARNELSITDKMEKHQERVMKGFAKEVANTLYSSSYQGELEASDVDKWRGNLEPKDFRALKKMSIAQEVITDGVTYNKLATDAFNGIDVTDQAITAMSEGRLNAQDVKTLRDINVKDQRGFKTPAAEAQTLLTGLLAKAPTRDRKDELALNAQASRELNDKLEEFKSVEGREPSRQEANDIASETAAPYLSTKVNKTLLKAPLYGPGRRFKFDRKSLTVENVTKSQEETVKYFRDKWPGNPEAAKHDIQFIEQMKILNQWMALAAENEEKLARLEEYKARRR